MVVLVMQRKKLQSFNNSAVEKKKNETKTRGKGQRGEKGGK